VTSVGASPVNVWFLSGAGLILIDKVGSWPSRGAPRPLRRRIGSRDELRRHGRGGSERRVVESGKVLVRGADRGFHLLASTRGLERIAAPNAVQPAAMSAVCLKVCKRLVSDPIARI
jgi:hypothetical protein